MAVAALRDGTVIATYSATPDVYDNVAVLRPGRKVFERDLIQLHSSRYAIGADPEDGIWALRKDSGVVSRYFVCSNEFPVVHSDISVTLCSSSAMIGANAIAVGPDRSFLVSSLFRVSYFDPAGNLKCNFERTQLEIQQESPTQPESFLSAAAIADLRGPASLLFAGASDATFVLLIAGPQSVMIFDPQTGLLLAKVGFMWRPTALAFDANSKVLLVAVRGNIYFWSLLHDRLVHKMISPTKVRHLAVTVDSRVVVLNLYRSELTVY
jgi:hypothetical protein